MINIWKRILTIFTILILFAANISLQTAKAETSDTVMDIDKLYENAKTGISDLSPSKMNDILSNVSVELNTDTNKKTFGLNETNGEVEPSIQTYATANMIESSEETSEYAITVFSDITLQEFPIQSDVINPEISLFSSGQWSDDKLDSSISVKAYTTIYVEAKDVNGTEHLRLTRTTGGWNILDSSVTLSDRHVTYGTSGASLSQDQSITRAILANTFDIKPPKPFKFVNSELQYVIGSTSTATLTRGKTTWKLELVLKLIGSY